MWKHNNFINLQLWAGNIVQTTINWDSHITKVTLADSWEWTESGQTDAQSAYSTADFVVTLQSGFIIDTVTATNGYSISNITDTTFHLNDNGSVQDTTTITITSQQSTPTLTFKHFFNAGLQGTGTIKFRHYSQQEPSTGETWVLNENPTLIQSAKQFDISFTSNNNSYTYLKFGEDSIGIAQALYYGTTQVYEDGNNAWTDQAYRTITFATPPTGDLLTWLQANGVKQ